ncbi:MAG: S9 family peptidase [Undibacterium sp.]|nr:S9 family peptidase [Opitutaceae bacterium]
MRVLLRLASAASLALAFTAPASAVDSSLPAAQPVAAQRPLSLDDFDAWRSLASPNVSRDGRWLAYSFMPQDGDGEVIIRELATGREQRLPVGALPPPPLQPDEANPDAPPTPRTIRIVFTADSQHLVASTYPTKAESAAARKAKKKPDEMPKGGLAYVHLANSAVTTVASVKNFQVPAKATAWLAYLKEARPEEKKPEPKSETTPPAAPATPPTEDFLSDSDQAAAARTAARSAPAKPDLGTDLVLLDLAAPAPTERVFTDVLDYSLTRDGRTLLTTVAAKAGTTNGAYAFAPGASTDAAPTPLLTGKGKYLKLTWDREQTQAAFVSDRDDAATTPAPKSPRFKLYHWPRPPSGPTPAAPAAELVSSATANFPAAFTVSDKGVIAFSRDGKKLYVPAAPPAKPPRDPDAAVDEEARVSADLWRWNDDLVQPMQKVRATLERNRTYRGVLDLTTKRYTQLADSALATVTLSDDGTRALGQDDRAYRRRIDYDGRYLDVYLVDPATGTRKLALSELRSEGALQWSPDGRWAFYYQAKNWHVLDTTAGTTRNLTASLGAAFHDEQHDSPDPAGPYGQAGWTKDSQSFLLYDRYDVWQIFPDARPAKNLTAALGRATKTQLRVQRIEPIDEEDDDRGLDPAKALTLRGESEETRASGFFQTRFDAAPATAPRRLLWGDKNYRYVARAKHADILLVSASRFDEFPDYHTTDSAFTAPVKVTTGSAQLAPFKWGRSELAAFRNADGVPLSAGLYLPPGFDRTKKYPLMIYIYERLSQNVNTFSHPAPSHNVNFPLYTSNGYIVLTPDIVYTEGQPGQSALRSVLPAIETLVRQGFIDENAIGISGHSWGGYQIAYMVTQTSRFRAAEAGAPVGNMTSAYSGIRWGSGLPRQFQYEKTQSRLGRPLAEAPQLYLENSPIFHVQRINTPLLLLHNDADDAVPWYQGIELFLALRRYNKSAWLWSYSGEFHGLRRRADQKDFARRAWQFFEHYLHGAPAPEWMEKGVPYTDRDEEKERFRAMK